MQYRFRFAEKRCKSNKQAYLYCCSVKAGASNSKLAAREDLSDSSTGVLYFQFVIDHGGVLLNIMETKLLSPAQ